MKVLQIKNNQGYIFTWHYEKDEPFSIRISDRFDRDLGEAAQIIFPQMPQEILSLIENAPDDEKSHQIASYIESWFKQRNPFSIQFMRRENKPIVVLDSYGLAGGGWRNVGAFAAGAAQTYAGFMITTLTGGLAAPVGSGLISSGMNSMTYSIFTDNDKINMTEYCTNMGTSFVAGAATAGVAGLFAPVGSAGAVVKTAAKTATKVVAKNAVQKVATTAVSKTAATTTQAIAKTALQRVSSQTAAHASSVVTNTVSNMVGKTAKIVTERVIKGEEAFAKSHQGIGAWDNIVSLDTPLEALTSAMGSEASALVKGIVTEHSTQAIKSITDIPEQGGIKNVVVFATAGAIGGGLGGASGKVTANFVNNKIEDYHDKPNKQHRKLNEGVREAALFGATMGAVDGVRRGLADNDKLKKEAEKASKEKAEKEQLKKTQERADREKDDKRRQENILEQEKVKNNLKELAEKLKDDSDGLNEMDKPERDRINKEINTELKKLKPESYSDEGLIKALKYIARQNVLGASKGRVTDLYENQINNSNNTGFRDSQPTTQNSNAMQNPQEQLNEQMLRVENALNNNIRNGALSEEDMHVFRDFRTEMGNFRNTNQLLPQEYQDIAEQTILLEALTQTQQEMRGESGGYDGSVSEIEVPFEIPDSREGYSYAHGSCNPDPGELVNRMSGFYNRVTRYWSQDMQTRLENSIQEIIANSNRMVAEADNIVNEMRARMALYI